MERSKRSSLPNRQKLFVWTKLSQDQLDHELIWFCTSAGTALVGCLWLWIGARLPACTFRAATGFPCPTCGATRATLKLLKGDIGAAIAYNPLFVLCAAALLAYNVYAGVVLAGRLPRLRIGTLPPNTGRITRWAVALTVLVNWAWLVWSGV